MMCTNECPCTRISYQKWDSVAQAEFLGAYPADGRDDHIRQRFYNFRGDATYAEDCIDETMDR